MARWSALGVGVLAILVGLLAQGLNVAVLVILAIAVAASASFPVIFLSLFWRRFNTTGVIGGVGLGLISAVALGVVGPAVRGPEALFPLANPTLLSMPIGFAGAIFGTFLARRNPAAESYFDKVFFRAHTGAESEV